VTAPPKIRVVCATREPAGAFATATALGKSLALYKPYAFAELKLFSGNSHGLPQLYNSVIRDSRSDPAVLVFAHDDVHLCDFYWPDQLLGGLAAFDIVGLAGNRRRVPRQPSWAFVDERGTWDERANLSGIIGHGRGFPCDTLNFFGPPGQEVKLLDGVMLAARSETLLAKGLFFDERFDFHFYDLDFCRQAEQKKVRMGTWPISAVHESGGGFSGPSWKSGYAKYLEKWGA
jgi:hypothetical protein